MDATEKPINPKDAIGSTKLPLHLWPAEATAIGCLGMLEGHEKYGFNNYLAGDGVIASIYLDAAERHLKAFASGEELTRDTENFHLSNLLASIAIIVKARAHGKLIDDREFTPSGMRAGDLRPSAWPTTGYVSLVEFLTPWVKKIKDKFANRDKPRHYTIADNPQRIRIDAPIACRTHVVTDAGGRRSPDSAEIAAAGMAMAIADAHRNIGGVRVEHFDRVITHSGIPGDDQEADFHGISFGGTDE